jgi:hypothetical protein
MDFSIGVNARWDDIADALNPGKQRQSPQDSLEILRLFCVSNFSLSTDASPAGTAGNRS